MKAAAIDVANLPDAPEPLAIVLVLPAVNHGVRTEVGFVQRDVAALKLIVAVDDKSADDVSTVAFDFSIGEFQIEVAHPLAAGTDFLEPEADPRAGGKSWIGFRLIIGG